LITDPVFGNATPFYPRQSALPFPKEALPPIDIILLSHNHRDHMSKSSLRFLKKANPNVQILTGLNMESLLKGVFKKNQIQCAGWYQRYHHPSINISFLPSRHWSKRGMFDFNDQLWGAFIIEANGKSIYFSGDTGYGNHLSEAGHWFHPDYVIVGIGAYQSEWFMESNHISPKNAIRAFQEMKGKWMIPMHYGCFDLSNESLEDPIRVYKEHRMIQENPSSFLAPVPGEIIYLQPK
jgi:L-ascorbate metabolism protein UlaG (beta-lactamase superfamily)